MPMNTADEEPTRRASRRKAGRALAAGMLFAVAAQSMAACPSLGVIRWDAWFGAKGVPGMAVEKSLGPSRWHDRLPVCGDIVAPDSVRIACDSPDQMAQEIDLAAAAGVGFWAFVTYPDDDPMSLGLRTYLRAANRQKLGFALITELSRWGDARSHGTHADRFVRLMREPGYQRTPDGRPVLFLGFVTAALLDQRFGGAAGLRRVIDDLRTRARAAGLAEPYVVLLEADLGRAGALVTAAGFDAVSAYALSDGSVKQGTYAQLTTHVEAYWSRAARAGLSLVPPAMTGWDRRPRVLNPVPWERGAFSEDQLQHYFGRPTGAELTAHLAAALKLAAGPSAPARMALVYAWNEFDEGGWLAPTRGDGIGRLDAVRRAIADACPQN